MPDKLVFFAEDECCNRRIVKASGKGELEGKTAWYCPKCGIEWQPRESGPGLIIWEPHVYIAVVQP